MSSYTKLLYEAYGYILQESDATEKAALRALKATPSDITLWARTVRTAERSGKWLVVKHHNIHHPWKRVTNVGARIVSVLSPYTPPWHTTIEELLKGLIAIDIRNPADLEERQDD